jgi:hypothetical protein
MEGRFTGKALILNGYEISGDEKGEYPVQGAAFSPNGHLYVSSNLRIGESRKHQPILYFSALNGAYLGEIAVQADYERDQELEGLCCVGSEIYVVLLETWSTEKDDIFFKIYTSSRPELV